MERVWLRIMECAKQVAQQTGFLTLDQARETVRRILHEEQEAAAEGSAALDFLANQLVEQAAEFRRPG